LQFYLKQSLRLSPISYKHFSGSYKIKHFGHNMEHALNYLSYVICDTFIIKSNAVLLSMSFAGECNACNLLYDTVCIALVLRRLHTQSMSCTN
jgi:hypothetical protein